MASTSVSGTGCAGPIAGWGNSRRRAGRALIAALALTAAAPLPDQAELDVRVAGLRDSKGMVMLCLTRRADFLDCARDPGKITRIVPAGQSAEIRLSGMAPGDWSLLAIHDANRNGKLDTMLGMPIEGFGFSRNPHLRMGPPRFDEVRFPLAAPGARQQIQMRYLL